MSAFDCNNPITSCNISDSFGNGFVKTKNRQLWQQQQKQRYPQSFTCLFLWWLKMIVTWLPPPPRLPWRQKEEQEV
jgi:hypothetical protein